MTVSRRNLVFTGIAGTAMLGAGMLGVGTANARFFGTPVVPAGQPAPILVADDDSELMKPGPLGERVLGDPDAPITIVEYASMTCVHCANFHKDTYPRLKEEFIDTGKVKFVFREFPLDPVAMAAFMLARCVPEEQYFTFISAMFNNQDKWAFTEDRIAGLTKMGKQAGLTQEKFEECLTNQELLDGVNWVKERGASEFEVNSTPTFFLNGEMIRGGLSFEEFEKRITPLLPS